jgi:ribonuclease G
LVLTPYCGQCGISRKIDEPKERMRLRKIIQNLTLPPGMGVIFRTAAEGQKERYFIRDLHILLKKWEVVQQNLARAKEPTLLYQEPDIIERTVRDFLTEKIDRILVDNEEDFACMSECVKQISTRSKSKIKLFTEDIPIFERFGIEGQIEQIFKKHITLPSGGSIVIQETEALTAIDVNTGAHKIDRTAGKGKDSDFIFQVNKEAVKEVVHQLQLRNIAGLIIIDFIDMPTQRQKRHVLEMMRDELRNDKAKTQALPIIQFGFMALTRQRKTESFLTIQHVNCPYCEGRGLVKSPSCMSAEIQRQLYYTLRKLRKTGRTDPVSLSIVVSSYLLDYLRTHDEQALLKIEKTFNAKLLFKANPDCHMENFRIVEERGR